MSVLREVIVEHLAASIGRFRKRLGGIDHVDIVPFAYVEQPLRSAVLRIDRLCYLGIPGDIDDGKISASRLHVTFPPDDHPFRDLPRLNAKRVGP